MSKLSDKLPEIPITFTGEERKLTLYTSGSQEDQEIMALLTEKGYNVVSEPSKVSEPVIMRGLESYQGIPRIMAAFSL